jgi:hypothetical protein
VVALTSTSFRLEATGVIPGKTNLVQASVDLLAWTDISTNVSATNRFTVLDSTVSSFPQRFYRLLQLP